MEELEEIRTVRAASEWMKKAVDIGRSRPAITYEKLPILSVSGESAVAVKILSEPRPVTKDGRELALIDVELIESARVYSNKQEYTAEKGTKVSMNVKRHASLWRMFQPFLPCTNKELVIINLGKHTFKAAKAPKGKATGYDYRIMLLSEFKAEMEK